MLSNGDVGILSPLTVAVSFRYCYVN